MLWSVDVLFLWVNEWMHIDGCAIDVKVENVEYVEFFHEWFGM
jgi:hypothetical protein